MICDLAEYYNIHDYKKYSATHIATLAKGLSPSSRIKRLFTGVNASEEMLIQSLIFDRLNMLLWIQTKDGSKGRNKPVSLYEQLTNSAKNKKQVDAFETSEDFELKRKLILQSIQKGEG